METPAHGGRLGGHQRSRSDSGNGGDHGHFADAIGSGGVRQSASTDARMAGGGAGGSMGSSRSAGAGSSSGLGGFAAGNLGGFGGSGSAGVASARAGAGPGGGPGVGGHIQAAGASGATAAGNTQSAGGPDAIIDDHVESRGPNLLVNPGFEDDWVGGGWSLSSGAPGSVNIKGIAPLSGVRHLDIWLEIGTPYEASVSQTVSHLPEGEYQFSIYCAREPFVTLELFARGYDATDPVREIREDINPAVNVWPPEKLSISSIHVTSGQIEVGIRAQSDGSGTYANCDDAAFVAFSDEAVPIATGQLHPQGLVIDASYAYVSNDDGTVRRVSLAGGTPELLTTVLNPAGLALDGTDLYFSEVAVGGRILKLPLAGGTTEVLAADQFGPQGVAVDETHVYWGNHGPNGGVFRMPMAGGELIPLVENLNGPGPITAGGGYVYFATLEGGELKRVPSTGGTVEAIASGQVLPRELAIDDTHVYWLSGANQIMRAPLAGGEATLVFQVASIQSLLLHQGTLYVASEQGLIALPMLGGSSPHTLVPPEMLGRVTKIAANATHVYWADFDREWVMRVAK